MKKEEKNKIEEKVMDAEGKSLGRFASAVASVLSGKNKTSYQRHIYSGVPVKVINASKLRLNSRKLGEIFHKRYSGYPGGLKEVTGLELWEKGKFEELVKHAVYKMLPGNKLRREMMKNLKIEA